MKKFILKLTLIKLAILLIAVLILSSCGTTRNGCPDTWNKVGYK